VAFVESRQAPAPEEGWWLSQGPQIGPGRCGGSSPAREPEPPEGVRYCTLTAVLTVPPFTDE
jgi:hypothetical protein